MKFIQFILKRKILVGLLVFFVIGFGLFAVNQLDKKLLPTIKIDAAVIELYAGDLDATVIEEQIVGPLEQRLLAIATLDNMLSFTYEGNATIRVFFDEGTGDEGYRDVQAAINEVENELIGLQDYETFQLSTDQPFEHFMEISNGDMDVMSQFAKDVLKPRLESLSEVREVSLSGLTQYEVTIELDQNRISEYGLDPQQIIGAIQETNRFQSMGSFSEEEQTPTLKWDTTLSDKEDVEKISILSNDGPVRLGEMATVTMNQSDVVSNVWKEGSTDFIFVRIGRSTDANQIDMALAVREEIKALEDEGLVDEFEINEIVAQADYVDDAMSGVQNNVLIGGIVALFILLAFLRNIRATVVIALAIPSSILLTFIAMWVFDFSFNLLTLIALGLGIGMIVDSSIVILESIYKKKEEGLKNFDAVVTGTKEVASAVIASMLTTIVVFLPIGIIGGEIGEFILVLSMVVIITLTSSVIIAFTLIPVLSDKFVKVKSNSEKNGESKLLSKYGAVITWITRKKRCRLGVIALFVLIFIGSMAVVSKIPTTVIPDMYNRYSEVQLLLEPGTTLEERTEVINEIDARLSNITDVETNYVMTFENTLFAIINMTRGENITREQSAVNEEILSSFREMTGVYPIKSVSGNLDAVGGSPVQIDVQGKEFAEIEQIAEELRAELRSIDGIVGVTNAQRQSIAQHIIVDEDTVFDDGLTPIQIKQYMEQLSMEMPIGMIQEEGNTYPIIVSMGEPLTSYDALLETEINTPRGTKVLSEYVSLENVETPNQVLRKKGERYIIVQADIEGRDLGSINRDVQNVIKDMDIPMGYSVSLSGDLEEQQKAMTEMMLVLLAALFLVYFVMAVQFNHLAHPLVVMSVIPVTMAGVIIGLLVTQRELSIFSSMGVIMLIGIILNNAILLLDRTKQLRKAGYDIDQALVTAGKNRLRPIFMTTLTTAGGMLPLAFATGSSGNFQAPIATVIISGLLFGTLITLILIPAVYMTFNDIGRGLRKIVKRKKKDTLTM
ncbi:efflux RND transporter permease subunit [Salirhabdus salicampi]|uniref:efflux RND transporter permease subunit n=1 Tax=Salirhabdus salicampi TaxID=476102 RepID=UPI0020C308EB|nr:efflux RND transporter permease subunit [Salirhabdus salicampi]